MKGRMVAATMAVCIALVGCSRGDHASESRPLTVVLFDVSRSTRDSAIRERYLAAFEQVVDASAAEHGTVVGDVIDANPLAHSTYPIYGTFEACDPLTDNRLTCEARDAALRDQLMTTAEVILSDVPSERGTDIHDGVRLAERVFAAYPEATSRSLV